MEELEQKDKYYIPSLEEWHVGFEYEVKCIDMTNGEKSCWSRIKALVPEDFTIFKRDILLCRNRVKYLDAEDIESFGFKPDPSGERYFELGGYQLYVNIHPIHNITIYNEAATIIFQGTVKNANELKKVLQMIGVL